MLRKESAIEFEATALPGVILIEPGVHQDDRGYFLETYQLEKFQEVGIKISFVQDNHSGSKRTVLRGLHYQIRQPQGKLVRVVSGRIFDVAVDLRSSSSHFGRWLGVELSGENRSMLWVPPGFAHGFYVLSEWAEVSYKVSEYYAPEWERTLLWNDPKVSIAWPLIDDAPPLVSKKDAQGQMLVDAEVYE